MAKGNHRWEKAVAAILSTRNDAAAAEKVGCSVRTLRSWKAMPAFQDLLRAGRRRLHEQALMQLERNAGAAVRTLRKNLKAEKSADQIRAALGILDQAGGMAKTMDHEERLANIERLLKERDA